jgi:hypothetical protein
MTFIKALLFPLAVYVALLVPEYELRWLDGYWSDTAGEVFSPRDHGSGQSGIAADGYMCLLCSAVAPWEDDESDDD